MNKFPGLATDPLLPKNFRNATLGHPRIRRRGDNFALPQFFAYGFQPFQIERSSVQGCKDNFLAGIDFAFSEGKVDSTGGM